MAHSTTFVSSSVFRGVHRQAVAKCGRGKVLCCANTYRRTALLSSLAGISVSGLVLEAKAILVSPPGYSTHIDQIDAYTFFYPSDWIQVTSSGNDVFYRSLRNLDENVFVSISSPSTSKYESVRDLGSPQEAAEKTLNQYVNNEFMSTRIGVKREAEIISVSERESNGTLFYDLEFQVRSYASRQQLAITEAERQGALELEWDRRLLTTLGVANKRLYELRLQTSTRAVDNDREKLQTIQNSFRIGQA